jgi:hypothetical protein
MKANDKLKQAKKIFFHGIRFPKTYYTYEKHHNPGKDFMYSPDALRPVKIIINCHTGHKNAPII